MQLGPVLVRVQLVVELAGGALALGVWLASARRQFFKRVWPLARERIRQHDKRAQQQFSVSFR